MRPYSAFIHAYILFPDIFACIFSFSTYLSIIKVTNKHCAGGVRPSSPLDFVGVVRVNNMLSAVWVSIVSVLQFISAQHFVEDGSIFILFFLCMPFCCGRTENIIFVSCGILIEVSTSIQSQMEDHTDEQ